MNISPEGLESTFYWMLILGVFVGMVLGIFNKGKGTK
jgi:hypothetical protein